MPAWLELPLPWYDVTWRLFSALVCAGLVGFDREQRGHPAGLRTHMLIGLGAATFALVGLCLYEAIEQRGDAPAPGDALRTISAVVGGIGFLGAGAIIHSGGQVKGLTTAAGMWTVAAIGVACGTGLQLLAFIATALAVSTLVILKMIEPAIPRRAEDDQNSSNPRRS